VTTSDQCPYLCHFQRQTRTLRASSGLMRKPCITELEPILTPSSLLAPQHQNCPHNPLVPGSNPGGPTKPFSCMQFRRRHATKGLLRRTCAISTRMAKVQSLNFNRLSVCKVLGSEDHEVSRLADPGEKWRKETRHDPLDLGQRLAKGLGHFLRGVISLPKSQHGRIVEADGIEFAMADVLVLRRMPLGHLSSYLRSSPLQDLKIPFLLRPDSREGVFGPARVSGSTRGPSHPKRRSCILPGRCFADDD
jgi:hypothetical protein